MPVTTRSNTRSPPTSRSLHTYSLRENRPAPGHFARMEADEDMEEAAEALMMLSQVPVISSVICTSNLEALLPPRRSARIASRA